MRPCAKFKAYRPIALLFLELCLRVCQSLKGSRDRPRPFSGFFYTPGDISYVRPFAEFEPHSFSRYGDVFGMIPFERALVSP